MKKLIVGAALVVLPFMALHAGTISVQLIGEKHPAATLRVWQPQLQITCNSGPGSYADPCYGALGQMVGYTLQSTNIPGLYTADSINFDALAQWINRSDTHISKKSTPPTIQLPGSNGKVYKCAANIEQRGASTVTLEYVVNVKTGECTLGVW